MPYYATSHPLCRATQEKDSPLRLSAFFLSVTSKAAAWLTPVTVLDFFYDSRLMKSFVVEFS